MFQLILKFFIQNALKGAGVWAISHGLATSDQWQAVGGVAAAFAGFLWHWYESHAHAVATGKVAPLQAPRQLGLLIGFLLLAAMFFTGCASSPGRVGHVVSVTERGFGLQFETTTEPQQTPKVKLGFFSSTVFVEPVVTNAQATVPQFANTFAIQQSLSPFDFGVNETLASGNYRTGNPISASNSVASEPAIPH